MGCGGCELFPSPKTITNQVDDAVRKAGSELDSWKIFRELAGGAHDAIPESTRVEGPWKRGVTTTNIWHLREQFLACVREDHGFEAAEIAEKTIRKAVTCYAAVLHLNKGANILKPEYQPKKGYAPVFEAVTSFEERMATAAAWQDLRGTRDPHAPWKDGLPRMIFVSDMGDALSAPRDFPFLKKEVVPEFQSEAGRRHLWLWLTKRPDNMARLSEEIGGFPPNLCAMTTLTGPSDECFARIGDLQKVKAHIRGLSIEPLWDRIPPSKLDLHGIDWVIVGGESGSGDHTRPFELAWVEELRALCQRKNVAFFLKQLGRAPVLNGKTIKLRDRHGGDWTEWDEALRVREFPVAFHAYRNCERLPGVEARPGPASESRQSLRQPKLDPRDKLDFKKLDQQIRKGIAGYFEAGNALRLIQERQLWKAGGFLTWEAYCRDVAGWSRSHAHRLVQAAKVASELRSALPIGNTTHETIIPESESQVRPLLRLKDPVERSEAWRRSIDLADGQQPTAKEIAEAVSEILRPKEPVKVSPSRSERRVEVVKELRTVIQQRGAWEDLELLVSRLEKLG